MGLIDRDGNVVIDPSARDSVKEYWKQMDERENQGFVRYIGEAGASPNGGPTTQSGESGASGGTLSRGP